MTPDELSRIREIYEEALSLRALERDAFLARESLGEPGIREEVDRLLRAHAHVPEWLEQPAAALAARVEAPRLQSMEGRRIGDYTLLREIGHGGMGAIYLAERSDGSFEKQVAINLASPSADTASVITRFQHEREILASLDHPNIARLLDGGVTEEGWPYFVME